MYKLSCIATDCLCVRPNVKFFCDLDYDPFKVMKDGKKVYAFTISLYEYPATIPTLWNATKGV
jgi:alpha 1,2-mannosyltransferase